MSRALLITGATGQQGGSVITALLSQNADFQILALTRDSSSASAKKLAAKSDRITLVQGDLDNVDAIFTAAEKATTVPIWGVFSVQRPPMNKAGSTIEETQGKALIDAAIAHKVQFFVYTSVDRHGERSSSNPTNIPHFISKHNIEQHLVAQTSKQAAGGAQMKWAVLRPVAFMENFDGGFLGKVFGAAWHVTIKSRPLQLVATADIGVFAAKAFTRPDEFEGQFVSLAGDELTFEQVNEIFKQRTGADVPRTFGFVARFLMWMSEEFGTMFAFFEKEGYAADIKALKKTHPQLKNFDTWLAESSYGKKSV